MNTFIGMTSILAAIDHVDDFCPRFALLLVFVLWRTLSCGIILMPDRHCCWLNTRRRADASEPDPRSSCSSPGLPAIAVLSNGNSRAWCMAFLLRHVDRIPQAG